MLAIFRVAVAIGSGIPLLDYGEREGLRISILSDSGITSMGQRNVSSEQSKPDEPREEHEPQEQCQVRNTLDSR